MKNCTSKYLQQFDVLSKFKEPYMAEYGLETFIVNNDHKEAMKKFLEMNALNKEF